MIRLNPLKFIKDKELYTDYECAICYQLTDSPVRCTGPCHKPFCLKCVSLSKQESSKCPLRCSDSFQVEPIPHFSIRFTCPFNSSKCQVVLSSLNQFEDHLLVCSFLPQQIEQKIHKNRRYLCDQNHKLLYINKHLFRTVFNQTEYQHIANLQCVSCKETALCTSVCLDCSTPQQKATYCFHCRTLPCTKFYCPLGHHFLGKSANEFMGVRADTVCHLCGLSPSLICKRVYFQPICGLELCERCQLALGEQNDLIPLKHEIYENEEKMFDQKLKAYKKEIKREQGERRLQAFLNGEHMQYSSSDDQESDEEKQAQKMRKALGMSPSWFHLMTSIANSNSSSDQSFDQEVQPLNRANIPQNNPPSTKLESQQQELENDFITPKGEAMKREEKDYKCEKIADRQLEDGAETSKKVEKEEQISTVSKVEGTD